MNKILIGLHIPSAQRRFDLFVPPDLQISVLTELLTEGVEELCGREYKPTSPRILAMREPDDILLRPDKTLADYGAMDGTQLVLF